MLKHYLTEEGTGISLWAHYNIDQKAMKFNPKQIYTSNTQVNFPDNFIVFKDNKQNQDELEMCLKDQSSHHCENVFSCEIAELKREINQVEIELEK